MSAGGTSAGSPCGISISPPQRPAFAAGKGGGYQKERQAMPVSLFGDPAGIRTPDPLLKRQLLCQLSYRIASLKNARGREELAGTAGLEPADEGVKVPCLTTWLRPYVESGNRGDPDPLLLLGWEMGLEPTTPGTTIRCSNQLSYTHHI